MELVGTHDPESRLKELSGIEIGEFWREADASAVGLGKDELAIVLLRLGTKYNYGLATGTTATRVQIGIFFRALQLQDLALAHACALGRDAAWKLFIARFREPLTQAAIGITGSVTRGQELADSLYADLFGLADRSDQPFVAPRLLFRARVPQGFSASDTGSKERRQSSPFPSRDSDY